MRENLFQRQVISSRGRNQKLGQFNRPSYALMKEFHPRRQATLDETRRVELKVHDVPDSTRADKLKLLVSMYFCVRSIHILILQGQYLRMQSDYLAQSSNENFNRTQLEQSIREHRLIMRKWGVIFRDLGPAAVLGYLASLAIVLFYCLGDFLSRGHLKRLYMADKFVMSYSNPPLADKDLDETFNQHLSMMILLNDKKEVAINKGLTRQLMAELSEQQAQLKLLRRNKASIWPANRARSWRRRQIKFLLNIYSFNYIASVCSSLMINLVVGWLATQQIVKAGEKPLYVSEQITLIEPFVLLGLSLDKFVDPMIVLIVNLRDKRLFLLTIQKRLKALREKLTELRLFVDEHVCVQQSTNQDCNESGPLIASSARLNSLRSACNEEALRVYLSLRVFLDELKPTIELSSAIAIQYFSTAILMLFTIPFSNNSDWQALAVLGAMLVYFVAIIDTVFLVCAQFESACIKTTQQTWSLVACFTRDIGPEHEPVGHFEILLAKTLRRPAGQSMMRASSIRPPVEVVEYFSQIPTGASLINEHTAMLWRRFTRDMPALHRKFDCKIFGTVRLNYSGMLRLNFWFISVTLTCFSQQRFK